MEVEELERHSPQLLDHDLNQYFPQLLEFESIEETERSDLYKVIGPTVERILGAVVREDFAEYPESKIEDPKSAVSVIAWNIERGNIFEGILDALKNHERLRDKDLLLLTELDYGMARTRNRFVAREL
ncbi:MAG TPA: hypothetical protein PKO33_08260, partial [Pyrinomonadaceae bacterium]|nr:hypothetical protein [Pyrinomonadaceae bacterium]